MIRSKPAVEPQKVKDLESNLKKLEADASARQKNLEKSIKEDYLNRQKQLQRESDQKLKQT